MARPVNTHDNFLQLTGATSGKVTLGATATVIHLGVAEYVDRVEVTFLNVTVAGVEVIIDTGAAMANFLIAANASLSLVLAVDGAVTLQATGLAVEVVGCVTRGRRN